MLRKRTTKAQEKLQHIIQKEEVLPLIAQLGR